MGMDGGLHDATTSGEGELTKHVPSVCENHKRCARPTCAPPPIALINSLCLSAEPLVT
jgi:hypothetical protein